MTKTTKTSLTTLNTSLDLTTSNQLEVDKALTVNSHAKKQNLHTNSNKASNKASNKNSNKALNSDSSEVINSSKNLELDKVNSELNSEFSLDTIDDLNQFLLAEQLLTDNNGLTNYNNNHNIDSHNSKANKSKPTSRSKITKSSTNQSNKSNSKQKPSQKQSKKPFQKPSKSKHINKQQTEKITLDYPNKIKIEFNPEALSKFPIPMSELLSQPLPVKDLADILSIVFAKPSRVEEQQAREENKKALENKDPTSKNKTNSIFETKDSQSKLSQSTNTKSDKYLDLDEEEYSSSKNYLDFQERKVIEFLLKQNFSYRLIAQILKLDKNKVWREVNNFFKKNPQFTIYNAFYAHRQYKTRLSQRGRKTNAYHEEQKAQRLKKLADAKSKIEKIPTLGISTYTEGDLAKINSKNQQQAKEKLQKMLGQKLSKLK